MTRMLGPLCGSFDHDDVPRYFKSPFDRFIGAFEISRQQEMSHGAPSGAP